MEVKDSFRYLGDIFSSKDDNLAMTEERITILVGATNESISLCKKVQFGYSLINNILLLYQSICLPLLIYHCEAWSNISDNDCKQLQNAKRAFLGRVMEVPKSTPVPESFLELSICLLDMKLRRDSCFS